RKSCTNDKNEQGLCVRKASCVNAVQTVDPTINFNLRERELCHYLETCCLEKNIKKKAVKPIRQQNTGCGWSNPGANVFREKNSPTGFADYGEFPWMVALIQKGTGKDGFNESYAGGGVLIHPSVVMTAAHKVQNFKPEVVKIRAGEWDTQTDAEVEPYQERDVSKIIIHEGHNEKQHNDVALLILKSPVDLSDAPHIAVGCLASRLPPPGTRCYSMGWGEDFLNDNKYAVILKKVELPLVEASDCESRYKRTVLSSAYVLDKTLMCAGGEQGVDTCRGDGGSPLVCPIKGQPDRFEVVGLVVYGLQCGTGGLPGVYLNVPQVHDWVALVFPPTCLITVSGVYNLEARSRLKMSVKIFIVGLALLYANATPDNDLNDWLNFISKQNKESSTGSEESNPDLTPTNVKSSDAERTCKINKHEEGVCVDGSLCDGNPDATISFTLREKSTCNGIEVCCSRNDIRTISTTQLMAPDGCGFSNAGAIPYQRPSDPGYAEFGEFPWMIAVIRRSGDIGDFDDKYAAGGALVHPKVVITATHKVRDYGPQELMARAGEYNTRSISEVFFHQERGVAKIVTHKQFSDVHVHYDVALLMLSAPFNLVDAPHIGVACLASRLPRPGTRCYSMGWGHDFLNQDKNSVILKKVEVPLVESSTCEHQYKNTKLGSQFHLHRTLTCAGGEEGADTCKGDGGSPLVCQIPNTQRFEVVGLVAYGLGCGTKLPGVYVNIPELFDWVGGEFTWAGLNKSSFVYTA
ncbi:serine proteinase protein 1, partial [Danaus plexippus plexippus]